MYIPVIFGNDPFFREDVEGHPLSNMEVRWWDPDNGVIHHPYLLLNAFEYVTKHKKLGIDIRNRLGIGKDVTVLGDSGGFQIWKFNVDVPILDVLRWQEANCDRAFIVDVVAESFDSDDLFADKMKRTVANCEAFEANRTNPNLAMYKVLHGHTEERIRKWYAAIDRFPFEGWSIGFHPSGDMWGQARMAMFLYHSGWRGKVHFLGASGRNVIPVMLWASKYFEDVVFDSSSYAMGVRSRVYMLPFDLFPNMRIAMGDEVPKGTIFCGFKDLPCSCPVCSRLKTVETMRKGNSGMNISLHNMWVTVDYCKKLSSLLDYEDLYLSFVEKNCSKGTRMAIDFMKMCVEVGYEQAVREYHRFMRLAVSNQEESSFYSMMQPKEKTRITKPRKEKKKPAEILDSKGEKAKKTKRKRKSAKAKGPVATKAKLVRAPLDLSARKLSKLEEKNERPGCYGEYDEVRCEDSGFCGEGEFEECRRLTAQVQKGSSSSGS